MRCRSGLAPFRSKVRRRPNCRRSWRRKSIAGAASSNAPAWRSRSSVNAAENSRGGCTVMSDEALLREKTATMARMLGLQGTIGMFGHVSIRVPGTSRVFISPGASTEKTTVRPKDIFVFDVDGTIVEHPGGLIPLEWRIHTQIHRDRPDAMCIAHLHALHARALGVAGKELVP